MKREDAISKAALIMKELLILQDAYNDDGPKSTIQIAIDALNRLIHNLTGL